MTESGREYGEALYELARDEELRPQLHTELAQIDRCLKEQPEFIRLIASRALDRETRLRILQETFGGRAHPYVLNFMKLLVEKERFDVLPMCCQWFHQRYNEDYGIVEARVTYAVALSDADRAALIARLEQISNRKVELICALDRGLIGGLRVEMEGKRYDNTIQDRLGRLKRSLAQGL